MGKWEPSTLEVGMSIDVATMENNREITKKKLRGELPYDTALPLLGTYPNNMKTLTQKDICTPMFIVVLFTITKIG